jgi:hypothetical protein
LKESGDAGADLVGVVTLGGLVVGDVGEGEVVPCCIDAGPGGKDVVQVALGLAAAGAVALGPAGVFFCVYRNKLTKIYLFAIFADIYI